MTTATHATIVATVELNGATPTAIRQAVRTALAGTGAQFVPCRWIPDRDTVADCTDVDYDNLMIIDMNG